MASDLVPWRTLARWIMAGAGGALIGVEPGEWRAWVAAAVLIFLAFLDTEMGEDG